MLRGGIGWVCNCMVHYVREARAIQDMCPGTRLSDVFQYRVNESVGYILVGCIRLGRSLH